MPTRPQASVASSSFRPRTRSSLESGLFLSPDGSSSQALPAASKESN